MYPSCSCAVETRNVWLPRRELFSPRKSVGEAKVVKPSDVFRDPMTWATEVNYEPKPKLLYG